MSTTSRQHPTEPRSSDPPDVHGAGLDRPVRRRRMQSAAAFVLGLAVGAGAFAASALASNPPGETRATGVTVRSVTPHVSGREIVAMWNEEHFGWVYVYDDGRVLSYTDGLHPVSREGEPMTGVIEQRLTPYGLELVAEGVVHPRTLLITTLDEETGIWSEAAPTEYSPAAYVMCSLEGTDPAGALKSVTEIEAQLPDFLRDLVNGAAGRHAHATGITAEFLGMRGYGIDCYGFTPDGADLVWNGTHARDGDLDDVEMLSRNGTSFARLTLSDESEVEFVFMPVLPHDGWVRWTTDGTSIPG